MNIHALNPYIRHGSPSRIRPPLHINTRIILDYELLYVESGEFLLKYAGRDYSCTTGSILLICPGIPHSFHFLTQPVSQPNIHFDLCFDGFSEKVYISYHNYDTLPSHHRSLIRENMFPELAVSPFITIRDREFFLDAFYKIIFAENIHSLSCRIEMLRLLQMILSENPSKIQPLTAPAADTPQQIRAYIDSNFQHNISLTSLEQMFGYSKYYIERLFKQAYGESVIHYYNRKRMEAATELLGKHSVTDVAQKLGFSSVYAFSRAFRTYFGISPTGYNNSR